MSRQLSSFSTYHRYWSDSGNAKAYVIRGSQQPVFHTYQRELKGSIITLVAPTSERAQRGNTLETLLPPQTGTGLRMPYTHHASLFNQPHPLLPHAAVGYMMSFARLNVLVAPLASIVQRSGTIVDGVPHMSIRSDAVVVVVDGNRAVKEWARRERAGQ